MKLFTPESERNFMLFVPVINNIESTQENGCVKLIFRRDALIDKIVCTVARKSRTTDITLDGVGSRVWNLIDGKRTIYDIGQALSHQSPEPFDNLYERLAMYFRYLNRRKWVAFDTGALQEKS